MSSCIPRTLSDSKLYTNVFLSMKDICFQVSFLHFKIRKEELGRRIGEKGVVVFFIFLDTTVIVWNT